jgi:hypothetical protein
MHRGNVCIKLWLDKGRYHFGDLGIGWRIILIETVDE